MMVLRHPYTAFRLPGNPETLSLLSDLWTEEHIFYSLDHRLKTFHGAHLLFSKIESGTVRVYGAFTCNGEVCGIFFGCTEEKDPLMFSAHVAFLRGVDTVACESLIERAIAEDYEHEGVTLKGLCAYIPEHNRAAKLFARRTGGIDHGIDLTKTFLCGNQEIPCRTFIKVLR